MDIVTLMCNRDQKGLSLLYDKYAASLLGVIVGIVHDKKIGEEILQSVMLKAWNRIESYDAQKGNLFTWLATIARRTAIDQIRLKSHQRAKNTVEIKQDTHQQSISVSTTTDGMDADKLLASLSDQHRIILDMIYLQGYTHRDTAQTLEIPLGTVKTRLRLAINILRKNLTEEKDLFLGLLLLLIFIIAMIWI